MVFWFKTFAAVFAAVGTGALKYSIEGERFMEIGTKTEVSGLYPGSGPKPITVADVVFCLSLGF